jgi:formylglycine-generating enzyme required for sulfatase activity
MVLPLVACDGEAPGTMAYTGLDEITPPPEGTVVEATKELIEAKKADASECGTLTARTEAGECIFLPNKQGPYGQRVQIPAGRLVRGSIPARYDGNPSREQPAVRWPSQPPRAAESDGFWIDIAEVTRRAYGECVAAGECTPALCLDGSDGSPDRKLTAENIANIPQTCVTHAQASAFCKARSGRLPTELEWEYAARGVDARRYPWGNDVRDEVPRFLGPIGVRADTSYFGILGLAGNAWEWVADEYVLDESFSEVLAGKFRSKSGPLSRSRAAWERKLACGEEPAAGCKVDPAKTKRFIVKSGRSGTRTGARADGEGLQVPERTLEGWRAFAQHPMLGFRCAEDLAEGDQVLTVPEMAKPVPTTAVDGELEFYGGVAEAVDHSEAKRFCKQLRVDGQTDWRLPTLGEVRESLKYRGPGPFWAAEGAIAKRESGPEAIWSEEEAEPGDALMARCVRSGTP